MGANMGEGEKDDGEVLYTLGLEDKSDGEGIGTVVVIEEGGGVGMTPTADVSRPRLPDLEEDDVDGDERSEKGDDIATGWEDAYEQEL